MKCIIIPYWLWRRLQSAKLPLSVLLEEDNFTHILSKEEFKIFCNVNSEDLTKKNYRTHPVSLVLFDTKKPDHIYDGDDTILTNGQYMTALYCGNGYYDTPKNGVYLEPVAISPNTMGLICKPAENSKQVFFDYRRVLALYSSYVDIVTILRSRLFQDYLRQ